VHHNKYCGGSACVCLVEHKYIIVIPTYTIMSPVEYKKLVIVCGEIRELLDAKMLQLFRRINQL
jgi:hypothetical protein